MRIDPGYLDDPHCLGATYLIIKGGVRKDPAFQGFRTLGGLGILLKSHFH